MRKLALASSPSPFTFPQRQGRSSLSNRIFHDERTAEGGGKRGQLVGLERTTRAGGRDKIDHPRGCHDDVANAAGGALVLAYQGSSYSLRQAFKDNLKMAETYKKWARAVA